MLVIKTRLQEIPGKGIALIADQEIKKGEVTWTYNPIVDIKIMKKDIPKETQDFFHVYAVDHGKDYVLLNIDNARFTNHSNNPTTKSLGKTVSIKDNVAVRDIHSGEEITIDYNVIDANGANY